MSKFIPNSFQLPNAFVDEMLAQVSGNACKVYLLIVRKTRGWQKEKDCISYSQIQKIAGIKSHETIKNALNELLELGLIKVKQGNEKTPNQYRLNDNYGTTKTVVPKSKGTTEIVEASTEIVEQGTTEIVDTENNSFKTTKEEGQPQNSDGFIVGETTQQPTQEVTEAMIDDAIAHLVMQKLLNPFELFNRDAIRFELINSQQYKKPAKITLANFIKSLPVDERIARFQTLAQSEVTHPSHIISAPVIDDAPKLSREEKLARIAQIERGEI